VRFYNVYQRPLWAHFGYLLVNGMLYETGKKKDLVHLGRTGPYVPPITQPWDSNVVILTDICRRSLESSALGQFDFRPVVKYHIARYDWHVWDRHAPEPLEYPQSRQAGDYILSREHSAETAEEMGDLWEIVLPQAKVVAEQVVWVETEPLQALTVRKSSWDGTHLFWGKFGRQLSFMVSDEGKAWLQRVAGEWLVFCESDSA
jgi:hypothetical protein